MDNNTDENISTPQTETTPTTDNDQPAEQIPSPEQPIPKQKRTLKSILFPPTDPNAPSDVISDCIGEIGKWQLVIFFAIFLVQLPSGLHQLSKVFIAYRPDMFCKNGSSHPCSPNCQAYEFDKSVFQSTIITEYDLVCHNEYLSNVAQSIFMFGVLCGSIIFGAVSDRFGRRYPLFVGIVLQLLFTFLTVAAKTYIFYVICRFVTGFSTGGQIVCAFVIVMEIMGSRYRSLFAQIYQLPFNLSHLLLPLVAYNIRNWKHIQLIISCMSLILLLIFFVTPESPRYYLAAGKTEKCIILLEKAAKWNKKPYEGIRERILKASSEIKDHERGSFLDLYRTKNIRYKTIAMNFSWLSCGMGFYGVAQYIGELSGHIFSNVAITASTEMPATLICILLLQSLGRRKTLYLSFLSVFILLVIIGFLPYEYDNITVFVACLAMGLMCICFVTVYVYTGELFPTVVRNLAIGLGSMMARIGSMISPYIASGLEKKTYYWVPPVILGLTPLISSVLVYFLPETQNLQLPDTLEEAEKMKRKK